MKKYFEEYYRPSESEFKKLWNDALFVFDTNVLLNLYRYSKKTSNQLLNILDQIKERIWIPYQVAKEFHRNRFEAISEQINAYDHVLATLKKSEDAFIKEFTLVDIRHRYMDGKNYLNRVIKIIKSIKKSILLLKKNHPEVSENDEILYKLTDLFKNDHIGVGYSDKKLNEIYKLGEERFSKGIPPGYKDIKKDNEDPTKTKKYGDLIIWLEIIDKAKKDKKPIIFVTDDPKEDWWKVISNHNFGPQPELIKEMKTKAGVKFYMYQSSKYIEYSKSMLGIDVDDEAISEVKQLKELDNKQRFAIEESKLVFPESRFVIDSLSNDIPDLTVNLADITGRLSEPESKADVGKIPPRKNKKKI